MMNNVKSEKIIIIGYSGHSFVVIDAIYSRGSAVIGYCAPEQQKLNPFDLNYLGYESEALLSKQKWTIAIGDNFLREKIFRKFSNVGIYKSVIHKTAVISDYSDISTGVFISANTTINAFVKIGIGAIINTGAIIEHECNIGDFAHIAPGAVLTGKVTIGNRAFIGANSVIIPGVTIGDDVIIGAGSVILRDVATDSVMVGNPSRKIN